MKKIFTFSFALMASATMFGQTELWGGENYELGSKGDFWDRCNQEVVANPSKDDVNSTDKCLKFTITGNDWEHGSAAKGITCESFESKRISLMIKKDDNSNVRIEIKGENDTEAKKVVAYYDGAGKWRKLYFDFSTNTPNGFPKEITIFPTTDAVEGKKEVYIDNIQIEDAPKVDDVLLGNIGDKSLTGNLKLKGSWLKGECQNADGGWKKVEYNDFNELAGKLKDGITSIDMRKTKDNKDVDIIAMRGDHSNVLVFANEAYDADNVVVGNNNDKKCANLVLSSDKAFATPEDFVAANVTISRKVYAGNNTLCLPFYVSPEELGAKAIATYTGSEEQDGKTIINFKKQKHVDANTPFIAQFDEANAKETLTFTDKGVVNTPAEMGNPFTGTYTPGNVAGKYGLNTNGNFQKGGANAHINAFSAYLTLPEAQEAKPILLAIDGETTGINAATVAGNNNEAVKVYNLQGCLIATAKSLDDLHLANGVYIVNNKKMVVK